MSDNFWESEVCHICGWAFTEESWDARHSDFDGEDIHAECCEGVGPCSQPDDDNPYEEGYVSNHELHGPPLHASLPPQ